MTREAARKKFMKLPVLKNGVYYNPQTDKLEFWFVFKGRKANIGGCNRDLPDEVIKAWEADARSQVRGLLEQTFGKNLGGLVPHKQN